MIWDADGKLLEIETAIKPLEIRSSDHDSSELVIFCPRQIFTFNSVTKQIQPHPINPYLPDRYLSDIHLRSNGDMWIAGTEKQLYFYDAAAERFYNYSALVNELIPDNTDFYGIYEDRSGNFWLGTRLGLLKVHAQKHLFDTYYDQPMAACQGYCSFRGIVEDASGNIYANYYIGIAQFHPAKKQENEIFSPFHAPFGLYIEDKYLWLNTGHRVHIESKEKELLAPEAENLLDAGVLAQDNNKHIWLQANGKLSVINHPDEAFRREIRFQISNAVLDNSNFLYFDEQQHALWFAFRDRLYAYRPESKELTTYGKEELGHDFKQILAMEPAQAGSYWLASEIGLLHWKPSSQATKLYTSNDGLPNDFICGMLPEGDSCLWLSSNYGLSRFHIQQEAFTNFFEEDGLSHNEFNRGSYFKARDGRMYFGGMRGINAFYPDQLIQQYRQQNKTAQLVLSSFEHIDEKRDSTVRKFIIDEKETITLNHWDKSFTFEYALTDFTQPEEIYYSFMMEGYEDNWSIPSSNNFTRFTSLPPGHYTFRVRARDHRGNWHANQLAIKIIMRPAWWESTWAYIVYVLLFLGLSWLVFRFMRRRLLLQNQLQLEYEESRRLKELDKFKSRLYTNLTHEFRTPLTVILGMVDQIRENPTKHIEAGTALIKRNGRNLLQLINQLLDLSKLENQSFKLQLIQGDMLPYLRYLTESFHSMGASKGLTISFDSKETTVIMDHDPEQIKQIITNLLSNAIKFTPAGGEVGIFVEKKGKELEIEVRDTGIGISENQLPYIFDRFYQVDSETTRQGEGTGIGLAHSAELVKLMGGTLSATSKLGKGSSFWVKLPIEKEAIVQTSAILVASASTSIPSLEVPTFEKVVSKLAEADKPQLLIVEDNPDVVFYLQKVLEEAYQVEVAYNGREGIEKALEQVPDLIISDVMMPEKDGFEVCDTLKNDERSSHIPIILLTAKVDAGSRIAGLKRGADAYLAKPFDKEELLIRIDNLLRSSQKMKAYFATADSSEEKLEEQPEAIQIENAFIQKVRALLEEHISDQEFALPQLCEMLGMSRSVLFRKMKALTDTSPSAYIRTYRLEKAKVLLQQPELNVSDVAWQVGFKDLGHFSRSFQTEFGFTPSSLQK